MADTVKHTRGPWSFQYTDESGECFVIAQNLGGLVGAALPWPTEMDSRDFRRVIANARLIAAAPELLLALQELLEAYSNPDERLCCDGRDCGCMGSTVHQQAEHYARAAIARATGGQ